MRVVLDRDPFEAVDAGEAFGYRAWPASWIHPRDAGEPPFVLAYRCAFEAPGDEVVRVHVSADERYELFLDGERIGRGPERGAPHHWFFESYDLEVGAGRHVLAARVWSLGAAGHLAPMAQMHVHHGFLLAAQGAWNDRLGTGVGPWQVMRMGGYAFTSPTSFPINPPFVGAGERIDAAAFPFGFARGDAEQAGEGEDEGEGAAGRWRDAQVLMPARSRGFDYGEAAGQHHLRPAMLPAQVDAARRVGTVRFAGAMAADAEAHSRPVRAADHDAAAAEVWRAMLAGQGPVTVPAESRVRVVIDLDDYYCAYPQMTVGGGHGASIRVHWAESLYEGPDIPGAGKGHRDEVEGKYFSGFGDQWLPDGGADRVFRPLWWRSGRYVQVLIETGDAPLTVQRLTFIETRYPFEADSGFDCDEAKLLKAVPLMIRGMQMCMHETYFDCPYYEQLMYVGDTRLEVLTTYALTRDDRLPRKAVAAFEWSRMPDGLTQARFPCRSAQVIPPFSLWWVCMVEDFAMWRGDRAFVSAMMPGVRGVLEAFRGRINTDGLIEAPPGWNFVDWEPRWSVDHAGAPPGGAAGVSGPINWQAVLALRAKAALEDWLGEPALAERDRAAAAELAARTTAAMWSARRGMLADDPEHQRFSEHSQCLALISGALPAERAASVAAGLLEAHDLARTTIYFSHYFFEACRLLGRVDALFDRLDDWYALADRGLRTPIERPEPTRSDCHAWGAHPLFHLRATVLGIRPASPGFTDVAIHPQLGPLERAGGTMPHPRGEIAVDLRRAGGRVVGTVRVPESVGGTVTVNGQTLRIEGGGCEIG